METQHAFDANRGTPWAFGLGIHWLSDGHQFCPRYDAVHLVEKSLRRVGLRYCSNETSTNVCCSMGAPPYPDCASLYHIARGE